VIEVGEAIKYKKADNPEGPVYSIPRSDLMMIKYANGTKDIFVNEETKPQPRPPLLMQRAHLFKGQKGLPKGLPVCLAWLWCRSGGR